MKTILYSLVILSLYSFSSCIIPSIQNKKIISSAFSTGKTETVDAFTSGYGRNRYIPPPGIPMKSPEISNHLSEVIQPPLPGNVESADEIPSEKEYYDGELNLNKMKVNCKLYTNKMDCFQQSFCGWCGGSSSCIGGSPKGPYEPCLTSTYIYSVQNAYQVKTSSTNYGGLQTNVVIHP